MARRVSGATILAIVLWGCTALLPVVRAQQSGALTESGLQQMLDGLGYPPKKLSVGYLIVVKQDTWTISIQVVESKDQTKIGLNANLGQIPKLEDVPAAQWLGLLEANRDIDPSAFFVDKSNQKLYLHRTMDNRDVTPAHLRQEIDNFSAAIRSTQKSWEFTK
jgi:hypothetical protein